MGALTRKPRVNRTLISLKVVAFFVLTGITALHILHATKPLILGFNFDEYRKISIIAPFVSILGPLIVGPLADRLAAKNANNFGRCLRILTAICLILAAIIYACLFAVPTVTREEAHRPMVSFGCNANGAMIFQERCPDETTCRQGRSRTGQLDLTNCTYTCQDPARYENMYTPWLEYIPTPPPALDHSSEFDYEDDSGAAATESLRARRSLNGKYAQHMDAADMEINGGELLSAEDHNIQRRNIKTAPSKVYVEPPHLCMVEKTSDGDTKITNCHVYTDDTDSIMVDTVLRAATASDNDNDTHTAGWCNYPLEGFQCQIPLQQANYMIQVKNGTDCKPMVECQVANPYDYKDSVLASSECVKIFGDVDATLAGYMTIRILGDIFPMAALTLLNTAIVVAVRETSEGRGEICRQYAWGAVGYVLLISPLDIVFFNRDSWDTAALVALILVIICFISGAIVLLLASNMPLSPPEWWWHTKTGILIYPMSAIRKYGPEIFLLCLVCLLFGTFWSAIHSYLLWTYDGTYAIPFSAILLVIVLFLNVDKFIEYCGHSNMFIAGFALFIIRFTALSCKNVAWFVVITEILEPIVVGVVWITIILYMRHVMPRKLTATGQAIAVLIFFGLGKGFGALIGLVRDEKYPQMQATELHEALAVAAAIIALIYFIMYNLILAPRCAAKPAHLDDMLIVSPSQTFANGSGGGGGGVGAGSGTGTTAPVAGTDQRGQPTNQYSPLRVYHNERGARSHYRY